MFDDLKRVIDNESLPISAKVALSVVIKAISWLPWVFVGIGWLLNKEYFIYWLAFFISVEAILFFALIYILVLLVRHSLAIEWNNRQENDESSENRPKSRNRGVAEAAIEGVIGNIAFYIVIIGAFIVLKLTGIVDIGIQALVSAVDKVGGSR